MTPPARPPALRPFLELIRVFLTPTAVADSYAGWTLAALNSGLRPAPGVVAGVAAVSILAYWTGLAANDLFDRSRDRLRAPGRPLPSGRVSVRAAIGLCAVLATLATGLASLLGLAPLAAALLGAALLYDGGGKNLPAAGNLLMGLCRAGNFLLGAAAILGTRAALADPAVLAGMAVLGLYIAGVTAVSRLEDRPWSAPALGRRAAPLYLAPAALALLGWRRNSTLLGAASLDAALLAALLAAALRASVRPLPSLHGAARFVRAALPGLFLVNAGLVAALSPPAAEVWPAHLTLYLLLVLAWAWKRSWVRAGAMGS